MKVNKYALLDTDFISKTYFIQNDSGNHLSDIVLNMPGYNFFCHRQIVEELERHNQQAMGWLKNKGSITNFVG